MDLHLKYLILYILSSIANVYSINTVVHIDDSCSFEDYFIHNVTDTQSYDLIYEGEKPPQRCTVAFHHGLHGGVCVEAIQYNVIDCNIDINYNLDKNREYSCNDPPVGSKCTEPGHYLDIRIKKKYPGLKSIMHSSFTLRIAHRTVGDDSNSFFSRTLPMIIAPTASIVLIVVVLCIAYATRRRSLRNAEMNSRNQAPQTQNVMYHVVEQASNTNTNTTDHHSNCNPSPHLQTVEINSNSVISQTVATI